MATATDPSGLIGHALHEARMRGYDNLSQFRYAVQRVMYVRSDMPRPVIEQLVQDAMWLESAPPHESSLPPGR